MQIHPLCVATPHTAIDLGMAIMGRLEVRRRRTAQHSTASAGNGRTRCHARTPRSSSRPARRRPVACTVGDVWLLLFARRSVCTVCVSACVGGSLCRQPGMCSAVCSECICRPVRVRPASAAVDRESIGM